MQHRGGPAGFLHVPNEHAVAFALLAEDVRGAITALQQKIELLERQLAAANRS